MTAADNTLGKVLFSERAADNEINLPSKWEVTKVKFVLSDMIPGGTPQTTNDEYWARDDRGIPWVKISDITGVDEVDNTEKRVSEEGISKSHLTTHPPGTLLFSMYASLGETAILSVPATTNQAILALYPRKDVCTTTYLRYYLKAIRPHLSAFSMSNTQDNLSMEAVGNLPIILPPVDIQNLIVDSVATSVETIDSAISNSTHLRDNLREEIHSEVHSAISGVDGVDSGLEWLGKVPEHWDVVRTRFVARLESGHTPSRSKEEYWENTDIPWVTTSDIKPFRQGRKIYLRNTEHQISELGLENSGARLLPKGTVFLSRTASVGFSGIMDREMATSQDFANWVCGDEIIPEYLLYVFRSMDQEFDRLMQGSTHQTIYMPDIRSFKTPHPPVDEQREIVQHIQTETNRLWNLIDKVEEMIDLLEEKRQSLITSAVTGQIDFTGEQDLDQEVPA